MQKDINFLNDLQLSSGSGRLQTVYEEIHGLCRLNESFSNVLSIVFFLGGLVEEHSIPRIPLQVQTCVEQIE